MLDHKTTLSKEWAELMQSPSYRYDHCAVCGRTTPLNQHHMVKRSQGEFYNRGVKQPKPTITLCGFGNHLVDADGRYYCHGLAHAGMLHFRYVQEPFNFAPIENSYSLGRGGHLEYLRLDEPVSYTEALKLDGWKRVGGQ